MRKLTDDEVMDYTYNKLFGDLDRIESENMFSDKKEDTQGAAPNAGTPGVEGISLTIKPLMKAAAESGRPPEGGEPEPEDHLKGISKMSSMMRQLHGDR